MTLADAPHRRPVIVERVIAPEPLQSRRLADLGLTPGARVYAELANAGSAARAYRLRGALIALRREHAQTVLVREDAA